MERIHIWSTTVIEDEPVSTRVGPRANAVRPSTSRNTSSAQDEGIESYLDADLDELLNDVTEPGPRRRERLNHLTQEQKMNRRKMKNRVAAQTARDRKKMRSQKLEDVVRDLLKENRLLREENSRLSEENEKMSLSVGSAAFINAPQQWDQVKHQITQVLFLLGTLFPRKNSRTLLKISRPVLLPPCSRKSIIYALRITKKKSPHPPAALTKRVKAWDEVQQKIS